MEETLLQQSLLETTRRNLHDYFKTHDMKYIADDAVFTDMSTGQKYHGKAEIGAVLHYLYRVAFDAHAETTSFIITADKAQVDGYFAGRHIGEFAGISATQHYVRVPLCVVYEMADGLIKEARIYMMMNIMMQQLSQ